MNTTSELSRHTVQFSITDLIIRYNTDVTPIDSRIHTNTYFTKYKKNGFFLLLLIYINKFVHVHGYFNKFNVYKYG